MINLTLEQIKPETLDLIEHQAETLGLSVNDYLLSLLPKDVQKNALNSNENFEADMCEFAENTEKYQGSYSREDIYFNHN